MRRLPISFIIVLTATISCTQEERSRKPPDVGKAGETGTKIQAAEKHSTADLEELKAILGRVKNGMTRDEVNRALEPVTIAYASCFLGGTGAEELYYRLVGDREVKIDFCWWSPEGGSTVEIGEIGPTTKWYGLFWTPAREDIDRAVAIVTKQLQADLAEGAELADKYPTNPAGMAVDEDQLPVTLELQAPSGKRTSYKVTASGRYYTHQICVVDLSHNGRWMREVWVDLDDKKVVPALWKPTAEEITRARVIADPTIAEWKNGTDEEREEIVVRAWGNYDYGPTRRLLVLLYDMPGGGMSRLQRYTTIEIDKGKLWEHE